MSLGHDIDAQAAEWRIRVYRRGTPMALSELLPLLDHLGFVALDEQPYTFQVGAERVHLYDIGVRVPAGATLDERRAPMFVDAFIGLVRGVVESDGFNRLVARAPGSTPARWRWSAPTPSTCARSASRSASSTSRRR